MPARSWLDLTTEEFRTRDMGRAIAILPVAAVEQHGPHLPVGTDTVIAQGYLARALAQVPDDLDVLSLPVQAVGKSDEHGSFPGTLTLSAETAVRAWTEIGAGVLRAGCTKLVIASAHGGNSAVADLVAGNLRAKGMLVVTTAFARFGYPEGLFPEAELRHGIHAGAVETALMRVFAPGSVREAQVANFAPRTVAMAREFRYLSAGRPAAFAWRAEDLHPSGAMGAASLGTAEAGEAALAHGAEAFVALLREVDRFSLDAPGAAR